MTSNDDNAYVVADVIAFVADCHFSSKAAIKGTKPTNEWMNEWRNEGRNEWMNEPTNQWMHTIMAFLTNLLENVQIGDIVYNDWCCSHYQMG